MAPALLDIRAMARRVSALLGIVVIVGLLLVLMWNVYQHHQGSRLLDEPAMVSLRAVAA